MNNKKMFKDDFVTCWGELLRLAIKMKEYEKASWISDRILDLKLGWRPDNR